MIDLWFKLTSSAKVAAWIAPQVRRWSMERDLHRVEGERQLKAQNFEDAEEHLSIAVAESDARANSLVKRIRLRLELAEAIRKQGSEDPSKLDEAEAMIREALDLAARASNPSGYVQCLDALAEVFHDRRDLPAMQALLEEGIRIEAAMPHPDPVRMARRVHRLGIVRHLQGEDPIPALEKAVVLHEQVYGPDHLETADLLSNLGVVYRAQGNYEEAIRCLDRSLRVHQRECGPDSDKTIQDLHHLAATHEETGDLESAADLYERALLLKQRVVGGDLDELAEMQFGVAGLYTSWGNFSRARELLSECIGTFKRRKGARLAVAYEALARVEESSGRYPEAVAELAKAGKVWESCGPDRAAELAYNLEYRAELLDQLRKKDSANWLREKARALTATAGQGPALQE